MVLMPPPRVADGAIEHRELARKRLSEVRPERAAAGGPLPQQRRLDPAGNREHGSIGLRETEDLQAQR